MLENSVSQIARLLLWPIIVNGLGVQMYGAWNLILQTTSHFSLGNMRVTSTLGLVLSRKQHEVDPENKRTWIGAHLVASIYISIALLLLSLIFCWFAPNFFNVPSEMYFPFRVALIISCIMISIGCFLDIPGMVLYATNQSYRMFIPNIIISLGSIFLAAIVVIAGTGIVGMSIVYALAGLVTAGAALLIAKKFVTWFGISRLKPGQVRTLVTQGTRFQLDTLASKTTFHGSALFLGYFIGLEAVTLYVITSRLLLVGRQLAQTFSHSIGPSFGDLLGRGELDAFRDAWLLSVTFSVFVGSCFLGVVIPLNNAFISLWLGPDKYGGDLLTAIIAAYTTLFIAAMPSAYALNQMMRFKEKLKWSIPWLISTVLLGCLLVPLYGLHGMAVAYLVATMGTITVGYPYTVGKLCNADWLSVFWAHLRLPILGFCTAGLGLIFFRAYPPTNIPFLLLAGMAQGILVFCACWWLGLSGSMRNTVRARVGMIIGNKA